MLSASDTNAVAEVRQQLWQAGYHVLAVLSHDHRDRKVAGKAPIGRSWPTLARRDPPDVLRYPPVPHALNTGALSDGLRPFDFDIDDRSLAERCRELVISRLGIAPLRFRTNSGRCLLVYRAAEGEPRKLSISGTFGKIEVLGKGQQFVAAGTHVSGAELQWQPPLWAVPRDDLTAVSEGQVLAVLAELAPLIGAEAPAGGRLFNGPARSEGTGAAPEASIERITALLAEIPNDGPADWEFWNRTGLAIWRATGGSPEGLAAWTEWSERNPHCGSHYRTDSCSDRWRHYATSPPDKVGVQTLEGMAQDARAAMLEGLEGHGRGNGTAAPEDAPETPRPQPKGSSKWDHPQPPDETADPLIAPSQPQAPYPLPDAGGFFAVTVQAVVRAAEADRSLAATVTLASMANAVARIVEKVEIAPGLSYALSLFTASIVGSSERKTTAERYMFESTNAFVNDELAPVYQKALAGYRADLAIYEASKKAILARTRRSKKAAKDDEFGFDDGGTSRKAALMNLKEPTPPKSPQLITNDFTIEGLRKRIAETGGMVAVITSEGAAIFSGYTFGDATRRAAGAGTLSRYWDGDAEDAARAGVSSTTHNPRVVMSIGVQPRVASSFFADLDLRDQGITSRFLVTWPASLAGSRNLSFPAQADLTAIKRFNDQAAVCLRIAHSVTPRDEDAPDVIGVTDTARQAWRDYALRTERRQAPGQLYETVRGYAGKAAEQAARIAAILTLFADPNAAVVDLDAMQAGIAVADWYTAEWARICDLVEPDPELKQAARLFDWLRATYGGPERPLFTARDVYRAEACGITTREPADRLLKLLAAHGLVVTSDPPKPRTTGRPPLVKWQLGVGGGSA